jgi:FkbM family methyltransferase
MTSDPASGDAVKSMTLLARDLAMFDTAASYDLQRPKEKKRSVTDLTRFFFWIADILQVDLFIEAGAKEADASRRARERFDPQRIVAFEANPYTFSHFDSKHDNAAAGVEYVHRALAATPGEVTFHVNRTEDGEPIVDGQGSLLKHQDKPAGFIEVTVEATTLDTWFADHEYTSNAMWVDVEGAVEGVFTGGKQTLERTGVVIVEVEDRALWHGEQWLRSDVVSHLYDRGLVPVARDFQSRYQYNIVFVRATALDEIDRLRWALASFRSMQQSGRVTTPASPRPPRRRKKPRLAWLPEPARQALRKTRNAVRSRQR